MNAPAPSEQSGARGADAVSAARAALAAAAGGEPVALITIVRSPPSAAQAPGDRYLVGGVGRTAAAATDHELDEELVALGHEVLASGRPAARSIDGPAGGYLVYAEPQRAPDSLVIVGAGHIAVPLARIGALLGFRVTVLDDREDFATAARFPEAAEVIRADFADPFRGVPLGLHSYMVLVTRGHRYDFDCLRSLLELGAAPRYIGLIGSRRRVRAAFHALLEAGVARERLARVRAPIGLHIGAETPEEIAVSIAAELVQVRRLGPESLAGSLTTLENVLARLLPE